MKPVAFLFNVIGILLCFYFYQSLGAIVFVITGLIPLLTLIAFAGLTQKRFTLVVMILNLCLSCAGIILIVVLLFLDALKDHPFSPAVTFTLISAFIATAILNMVILKKYQA